MNTAKISLVTIAFNDLAGVIRTVASIDSQTFSDWEHVIVDGGSTDGTLEWLKLNASDDERRGWVSEPDGGIYDAMNKGLSRARGELIMILNSADVLSSPDSLNVIAKSHEAVNWRWAYGSLRLTNPQGEVVGAYSFDPFHAQKFLMGLRWIPHGATIMTRELVNRLGSYRIDLGPVSDQEFLMRALKVSKPFVISWYLSDFALGGVSQSQTARARELAWHRMRLVTGNLWRNRVLDRAVSELLALRAPLQNVLKRLGGGR